MTNNQNHDELFDKVMQTLEKSREFPNHKEHLDGFGLLGGVTEKKILKSMARRLKWEIDMAWISPEKAIEAIQNGDFDLISTSAKNTMELKELRKEFCKRFNLFKD